MSVTDVKAKATAKTSAKKVSDDVKAALKVALDSAPVEYVPLSDLVISPLNARTIPYSADSVRSLADTIAAVGLLQNLVVHTLPDGKAGVAAGGRRLTAMTLLCSENRLSAAHPVQVRRVSDELAAAASLIENEQRAAMHPAEQITGFRRLAEQGITEAQIGEQLGYSARHVQRMLKLAGLAPSLLALLAKNQISVEQCQALCLEDDQARQVQVYEDVCAVWSTAPVSKLKEHITDMEVRLDSYGFAFIGREAYEAAGGIVREDLFSQQDNAGTADRVLVDRLVQEKLDAMAAEIQVSEGWTWSMGRPGGINRYGEDAQVYHLVAVPQPVYIGEEEQQLDDLYEEHEAFVGLCEDSDALDEQIQVIEHAAAARAWTADMKAGAGVVVSLREGEITVQRGVRRIADEPQGAQTEQNGVNQVITMRSPDPAEGISLPLLTKMSSERTLAVQAALMQQPEKAVALMVWRLCVDVFPGHTLVYQPFRLSLTESHYSLTANAPSGQQGAAYVALMEEKARLEALLPAGWRKDFTTFFDLDGGVLMKLMAFCTACSVEGVQNREFGHTTRSSLDTLEMAIGFHMRDWWHPTKDNFFTHLKHAQIVDALRSAGLTGAASDAEKMKKGDAASHAEEFMRETRWMPVWMKGPEPEALTEADSGSDEENGAHAA
ncbi:MAG: ParB/RepB/Spo0J family partition protein [Pantoea sp.]|uniref:ParB/RepB/Spo0J family partition protein n=1 Tax=Pantoea sp. TaxID=69393 RepID=UPI0023988312|nr:ParB/RepB/Spo0J family partition protein [Pantoea sp.]MDE1188862.1 ParB/RepB/Spo0J family partition protein [Pantoea sp.]